MNFTPQETRVVPLTLEEIEHFLLQLRMESVKDVKDEAASFRWLMEQFKYRFSKEI